MLPIWEVVALLGLGFCAGMIGGLIGIGGGVITIPALTFLLGRDIHLAQAASMNVVAFVAIPASIRHWKQGELETRLLRYIVPFGVAGIILGVLANNVVSSFWMGKLFGFFLLYVILMNVMRLISKVRAREGETIINVQRGGVIGSAAGFGAGLLGIGGGLITVPLSQKLSRLTLPHAIAISSGLMCFTSIVGAVTKDLTISSVADPVSGKPLLLIDALQLSLWLFPMAILGAWLGARFTHILPVQWIRLVFIIVLLVAALKYLAF